MHHVLTHKQQNATRLNRHGSLSNAAQVEEHRLEVGFMAIRLHVEVNAYALEAVQNNADAIDSKPITSHVPPLRPDQFTRGLDEAILSVLFQVRSR